MSNAFAAWHVPRLDLACARGAGRSVVQDHDARPSESKVLIENLSSTSSDDSDEFAIQKTSLDSSKIEL
jgi:hypothetical protein